MSFVLLLILFFISSNSIFQLVYCFLIEVYFFV